MIDSGWSTGSPEPDSSRSAACIPSSSSKTSYRGIEDKDISDAVLDKVARNTLDPAARKAVIQNEGFMPTLAEKVPSLSLFTVGLSFMQCVMD